MACPLCRSADSTPGPTTDFADIWRNLEEEWGARFSSDTVRAHTPTEQTTLERCLNCGLDYFDPSMAGSDRFYAELTSTSPAYYAAEKWEFGAARSLVKPGARVLDVACGSGAFIEGLAGAVGVDTNRHAVEAGRQAGRDVRLTSIEAFAADHPAAFDVVTAFQIIEHLPEVMPFVGACRACLRPGGILVVSVPNRDRWRDAGFGSLDYPPHHVSRWSARQLDNLASRLGFGQPEIVRQPLEPPQAISALRSAQMRRLPTLPRKVLSRIVVDSGAWDAFRLGERLNLWGLSLVAVMGASVRGLRPNPERPNPGGTT